MDDRAHPGEAVEQDGEQGLVAPVDQVVAGDRREERAGLLVLEDRSLADADDELRSAHGIGGVVGEDLADDQVVEEHPESGQVLLDGGDGELGRELLDLA